MNILKALITASGLCGACVTMTTPMAWASAACSDISFNDSACPAHLLHSGHSLRHAVQGSSLESRCSDISFNDSGCPAYLSHPGTAGVSASHGCRMGLQCSDISFDDAACPDYIHQQ